MIQYKQLKELEKELLKGISLEKTDKIFNTITGVYTVSTGNKIMCVAVTLDINSQQILEKNYKIVEEELPYNVNFIPFRDGPVIIDVLKGLKLETEVLMILGEGAVHKNKLGLASYVGIILNKPSIGIATQVLNGVLKEEKVYFKEEVRGLALRSKEFANPVYVAPGYGLDINQAAEITKKFCLGNKLPLPLHIAHKKIVKLKREPEKE